MDDIAIIVSDVDKSFKLPHEKQGSIKGLVVNFFNRKRTYERQHVLKNINLEIKKGEFFGIVGKNGGGKSTMLKILAGIYSPDKGAVVINGKLTAFIELGVGFNPELTGRENVYLSGALLGFSEKEVREMYDDIVNFAELKRFMDQKLKNYSSGMQVRLAFSIAIRAKSDILILDEVLAVGDAAFQQKCYDYFEELKKMNQTVVFVSHDMGAVQRFCTQAAYIKNGKLIDVGNPEDIASIYVEENMKNIDTEDPQVNYDEPLTSSLYDISFKISKPIDNTIKLKINYKSHDDSEMYVGLSISQNGVSIAEITTDHNIKLKGHGQLVYELNTSILNPGLYYISGVTLFKTQNREPLSFSKDRKEFQVKGYDIRRAAALKLPDTWSYEKN